MRPIDSTRYPEVEIHESAYIDEPCEIGAGTKIWHFVHVMRGCRIGRRCNLGQNVVIAPEAVLGDNVKVQNNVSIYTGVVLEDDVFCGPSMVFTNVLGPRSEISRRDEFRKTLVKRGATLGANSTILCGVTIGRYALVFIALDGLQHSGETRCQSFSCHGFAVGTCAGFQAVTILRTDLLVHIALAD